MTASKADAPNAAMTPRFHPEHHRRGVGDLRLGGTGCSERIMKKVILVSFCAAVICLPVVLWFYGHLEAYCVFYPGIDTYYAAGYSESAFSQVSAGMTAQTVEALLGTPLHAHTNKDDSVRWCYTGDGKCVWGDFAWLGCEVIFRTNRVVTVERIIYYD